MAVIEVREGERIVSKRIPEGVSVRTMVRKLKKEGYEIVRVVK